MKTMFKVMNEMNKDDKTIDNNVILPITQNSVNDISFKDEEVNNYSKYQDDGPSFFV